MRVMVFAIGLILSAFSSAQMKEPSYSDEYFVVLKTPPAEVFTTSLFIGALPLVDITTVSELVAAAVLIIAPKFLTSLI